MRFVTKQVELNVLVVGDNKMLSEVQKKVLSFDEGKSLKHIIVINSDDAKDTMKEIEKNFSVKCHKFKDIEAAGADNKHDHVKPSPEDVFVINYTSGTTGDPKGVMLTHKNGLADVGGVLCTISGVTTLTNEDVWLSYLPLPHVFERAVQIAMFQVGGRVGFFQGSLPLLADDLKTLAPTLFGGVPRVWARFYDKIQQAVSASAVKKFLFNKAVAAKKAQLAKGICNNTSLWDKIVLKNAQAILGGRCKVAFRVARQSLLML
jgi:long-chain acyl-CoA synthetase